MKAVFDHHDYENALHNIVTFWFKPERALDQVAGQYTELRIEHKNPDDRGDKRWFTISSSPTDKLASITTKFNDKGSSFKRALLNLKPGTVVDMAEPMGDFVLPKDENRALIFVAGGIGITPFHSITKWLADTEQKRDIKFIYAVSNKAEIVLQEPFELLGIEPHLHVGSDDRVDAQKIIGDTKPSANDLIYLSGPEPMIEALEKDLADNGIDKSQLVGDFFPGYKVI